MSQAAFLQAASLAPLQKLEIDLLDHFFQWHILLASRPAAIFVLRSEIANAATVPCDFYADFAKFRFHLGPTAIEDSPLRRIRADPERSCLSEKKRSQPLAVLWLRQRREGEARAVFFHIHRSPSYIECARFEQTLGYVAGELGTHIVDIGFQHPNLDGFRRARGFPQHYPQQIRLLRKVAIARPIADSADAHRRHWPETSRQGDHDGRPRRRSQLHSRPPGIYRLTLYESRRGGCGNRQRTVCALYRPRSQVERRAINAVGLEQLQGDARADNVDDGIGGAHFVKVNFFDRHLVNCRLRFRKPAKNRNTALFHGRPQARRANDPFDLGQVPVLAAFRGLDAKLGRRNAAARAGLKCYLNGFEAQTADLSRQFRTIRAGIGQRAQNHIPADAGEAVEVADFHSG